MSRRSSNLCALCIVFGALSACGARTTLDPGDYLPSGGGPAMSGASGAGPLIDPEVCARFAPLWQSRAAVTTLVCDTCLRDGGCGFPDGGVCTAGTRCVDRRCSVLRDLGTLCSCIESCFSEPQSVCDARWSTFMTCAANACKEACH
ncbi:MAG: hypothetical protein ABIQ16_08760 [Polyangiaceae bacterium]